MSQAVIRMQNKLYAALDVGGTKIYTVLADANKQIIARQKTATLAEAGPEKVIKQLIATVRQLMKTEQLQDAQLAAVGVCIAGFYDWHNRILVHSPNLPGWSNVPLEEILAAEFAVPARVENDANAAAVGEVSFGAGRNHNNVVFVTISTGIGAGLIINGQLYRGSSGVAGEIGHFIVQPDGPRCGCGQQGCLETVASGTAIGRQGQKAAACGQSALLQSLVSEPAAVTAQEVFKAARLGDPAAQKILHEALTYLGLTLVNIVNLLNPSAVILGGGVTAAGDEILLSLRKIIAEHAVSAAAKAVQLKLAALGEEAGVLGMLALL
ncbi:MAG TPA: transcriptional regulator [Firmicutes bacterium]|nr:transcriptional regulator [Bacillota bacterium]